MKRKNGLLYALTTEQGKIGCVFAGFALLILFYFLLIPVPQGDDIWFMGLGVTDVLGFVRGRYLQWSSRVVLEAILITLCGLPLMVSRVMMAVVAVWGLYVLYRLFCDTSSQSALLLAASFLLLFSFDADVLDKYFTVLAHTGFLSTTVNYLLPTVCALTALIPLQKVAKGRTHFRWYEWLGYLLCVIIGANQEQLCAILLATYLLVGGFFALHKKGHLLVAFSAVLAAASMVFILTCPGNASRVIQETGTWNPAFAHYCVLQKLDIGLSGTFNYLFETTPMVLLFEISLLLVVAQKHKGAWSRAAAAVPLFISLMFGPLAFVTEQFFPGLARAFSSADFSVGWLNFTGSPTLAAPAKFVVGGMCVALLCVGIYLAFGHCVKSLLMLMVFAAGLASRAVLGFSPTLVVSGQRTAFFLLLSLLVLSVSLFRELAREGSRWCRPLVVLSTCFGGLGYLTMCLPTLGI